MRARCDGTAESSREQQRAAESGGLDLYDKKSLQMGNVIKVKCKWEMRR